MTTNVLKNTITYDGSARVQQIQDANLNARAYVYNGGNTQVTVSNNGVIAANWTQLFDGINRNTGTIDATGHQETLAYEDANNPYQPTRLINRIGQNALLTYDPKYGNLLGTDTPVNGARLTSQYQYDYSKFSAGRMSGSQTGNLTPSGTAHYDTATAIMVDGTSNMQPLGLPSQTTSPTPGVIGQTVATSYVYSPMGNVLRLSVPGPNGAVTYAYNYSSDPAFNYTQAEALDEPLTVTDPNGHVTHYRYDLRGNLLSVLDPLGRETDYQYNDADQLRQITLPPKAANSPGRVHTIYTYLYVGGPLTRTDLYDENNTLGRTAQYGKGKEGEHKAQGGSVEAATLAYDPAYRVQTLADGNSHAFSHQYDLKGNLTRFSNPRANANYAGYDTTQGVYDNDDNLTQSVDGNNKTIQYTLAGDDSRLTDVTYPAGTLGATHADYDQYGRVVHVHDSTGDRSTSYDDLSNVLSITTTYTGLPAKTISYTYNADGSRASMTSPAGTTSYTYDNDGLVASVTLPWNQTLTYGYDAAHRMLSEQQTKFTTTWTYDGLDELTVFGSGIASFSNMTYDGAGNRLTMNASVTRGGGTTQTNSPYIQYTKTWTYDNRDELTREQFSSGSLAGYVYTHTYAADAADNLTTLRGQPSAGINADNQTADLTASYDGNGNPLTFAQQGDQAGSPTGILGYDVLKRQSDVKYNGMGGTTYHLLPTYRSDGLRASKQVSTNGTLQPTTYYLYDGTRVVCELGSSGASYGYGAAGLAQTYNGAYTAYSYDPIGSVTARVPQTDNTTYNTVAAYDFSVYDAFGNNVVYLKPRYNTVTSFAPSDNLGYGAQWGSYTDAETGLILMGWRYYSPTYCRFLTRDPSGYEGGINVYAYCRNNPVNYADPSGLQGHGTVSGHLAGTVHSDYAQALFRIAQDVLKEQGVQNAEAAILGNSATYTLAGGTSILGPIGVAVIAIPGLSYLAYEHIGVPAGNAVANISLNSVDQAYTDLLNRLRNCFVAGTLVAMADGTYKPIEQIKQGDSVLSRDPASGQTTSKQVVQTFVHDAEQTLVLRFDNGETVETTPGHPFYVEGRGFVLAGQLAIGNAIVTRAGPAAHLTHIENKTDTKRVYNFEVEGFHTYFVGTHDGGLWVHNLSFNWRRADHVFRPAAGHVNPSSQATKERFAHLFEQVASNPANLRPDAVAAGLTGPQGAAAGIQAYTQTMRNGEQIWVLVRGSQIENAGVNPPGLRR